LEGDRRVPRGWDNFYYLIGSASGGLIGLMFVVVTLTSGRDRSTMLHAASLYLTPTVAHFAVVLVTSAVALAPDLPARLRGAVFGFILLIGLFYAARACLGIARPRLGVGSAHGSDLWCYGAAPAVIYAGLVTVVGLTFWLRAAWAPTAMAGLLLALLLISIRNAWDLITWIAPTRRE
jgi:hypothetical protein